MLKSGQYKVKAIAAMDSRRVIGNKGRLVWNIPEDMKHFSSLTKGHTVVMGRKTFDSLPDKFKPLPGRLNVVISKSLSVLHGYPEVPVCSSIENMVSDIESGKIIPDSDTVWIIGGEQIYTATLHLWDAVELTLVAGEHRGDVFFPEFEKDFSVVKRVDQEQVSFLTYERK